MGSALQVSLAPIIDLHTGYHGTIIDSFIDGVTLNPQSAKHVFIHQCEAGFSPHEHHHLGELIEVVGQTGVVHSSRWPVIGCPAWLADTDDLLYPILCGRTAQNPAFRTRIRDISDLRTRAVLRRRVEFMTSCYAHPSCIGILLRGHPRDCVRDAREWFDWLGAKVGDEFFRKIVPIRPAQRAIDFATFQEKWANTREFRVIFCGRNFDYKNGHLALKAMRPLIDRYDWVTFVYVGAIPGEVLAREPELLAGVEHYPQLSHRQVLNELRRAHVLFHPSKGESIGISLLEAMGAGLAVVVARGGAMEYTDELFGSGGALLLDRDSGIEADEQLEFQALLERLITDPGLAIKLAGHNLAATTSGEFSLEAQGSMLGEIYRRAATSGGTSIHISDVYDSDAYDITMMTSADVWRDMHNFRERLNEVSGYKCIRV